MQGNLCPLTPHILGVQKVGFILQSPYVLKVHNYTNIDCLIN